MLETYYMQKCRKSDKVYFSMVRYYYFFSHSQLGGPDFALKRAATQSADVQGEGKEFYSHSGYKYFGAAKFLPGVREIFEQEKNEAEEKKRKTRKELYSNILPDYYGWREYDDVELLLEEQAAEHKIDQEHEVEFFFPVAMMKFLGNSSYMRFSFLGTKLVIK